MRSVEAADRNDQTARGANANRPAVKMASCGMELADAEWRDRQALTQAHTQANTQAHTQPLHKAGKMAETEGTECCEWLD